MAEQTPESDALKSPPKKFAAKTLLILGGVLVMEIATVVAVFMIAGEPPIAEGATSAGKDLLLDLEQPMEVLVVADKFPNSKRGKTYLYDTEIYIEIRKKNDAPVQNRIDNMAARIRADVATIFRKAEPTHLLEPELSTLKRQIRAALDKRLGQDENGDPYVDDIQIPKCNQFRADV